MASISRVGADLSDLIFFISLRGQVQGLGVQLVDITRPGLNGHAYRRTANHSVPFQMDGIRDCKDQDDIRTVFNKCLDLKGEVVDLIDDFRHLYTKVICLDVIRMDSFVTIKAVGGVATRGTNDKGAMLVVRFMLQVFG